MNLHISRIHKISTILMITLVPIIVVVRTISTRVGTKISPTGKIPVIVYLVCLRRKTNRSSVPTAAAKRGVSRRRFRHGWHQSTITIWYRENREWRRWRRRRWGRVCKTTVCMCICTPCAAPSTTFCWSLSSWQCMIWCWISVCKVTRVLFGVGWRCYNRSLSSSA